MFELIEPLELCMCLIGVIPYRDSKNKIVLSFNKTLYCIFISDDQIL